MNRAPNICSSGLLIAYMALQWDAMLSKSKGAVGTALLLETITLLVIMGTMNQAFRPILAVLLLVLPAVECLMFGSSGGLTGLIEAPTILLAICVMLANHRWAAVATLGTVILVVGSGVPTCYSRDAQAPIAVMFLSADQLVPVIFVTLFTLLTWISTRGDERNASSPADRGEQ